MAPKAAVAALYVLVAVSAVTMIATVALGPGAVYAAVSRTLAAYHIAGSNEPVHVINYQAHLRQVCRRFVFKSLIHHFAHTSFILRTSTRSAAARTTTTTGKCRESSTPPFGKR